MDHSIDELELLRRMAPPYFIWTPELTKDDWPDWFEDAVDWGQATIEGAKVELRNGTLGWMTEASSGDAIYKDGDDLFRVTPKPRGESELREAARKRATEPFSEDPSFSLAVNLAVTGYQNELDRQALATPSAPVSGLVAEIDALFEKASTKTQWEVLEHCKDEVYIEAEGDAVLVFSWLSEDDHTVVPYDNAYANADLLAALVNAWPRLKSALASRDEWRPDIENAPLDGTPFFAWYIPDEKSITPKPRWITCRFKNSVLEYKHSHGWFTFLDGDYFRHKISHWMPEPTPPTSQERKS